ncbi:hypothetical protein CC1G_13590 [Coprinopsis cinerea okayama7|uniref:Uncharacterized protein n=1 Tax=Coprinopsis cinerea (strain Okayama-7 / 130 / ATCC MYA-4618 / FGSC 9003) TaxID=240176 RepID=D6RJT7_COPC7|nr:hypothetical protein CC1G_13590 [Coprinopsis cinerea okayama7\|eukprot:XP_002912057.1 hypothetical protein CC1G_13590 [Coprinopsis cinerea okayama7\
MTEIDNLFCVGLEKRKRVSFCSVVWSELEKDSLNYELRLDCLDIPYKRAMRDGGIFAIRRAVTSEREKDARKRVLGFLDLRIFYARDWVPSDLGVGFEGLGCGMVLELRASGESFVWTKVLAPQVKELNAEVDPKLGRLRRQAPEDWERAKTKKGNGQERNRSGIPWDVEADLAMIITAVRAATDMCWITRAT